MYALINSKIYTGDNILDHHALIINADIIKYICPTNQLPANIKQYDLSGHILSPGFIDLQINGCGGVQFSDYVTSISMKTLKTMQITNINFGCTSFLPTLVTSSDFLMKRAVQIIRRFLIDNKNQVLGLHLEGPFLNPNKKGIHNASFIRTPTKKIINYICQNHDIIKKITLAPEQLINLETIKIFKEAGILVSIGHSNATYKKTLLSFKYGIHFGTHLFNAMPPLIAREPGVIGAIFDTPKIYTSIIADGVHVHWANIRYAKKIKKNYLILITDGTSPVGHNNITKFIFSGKNIYHINNRCIDKYGILSGSTLTMIQAIKNSVQYVGISLDEALRMATLYPARAMGIDHYLGSIEINKIANLVVFTKNYEIIKTIVNGKIYDIPYISYGRFYK